MVKNSSQVNANPNSSLWQSLPIPQKNHLINLVAELVLDHHALDGRAARKEVSVYLTARPDGPRLDLLIYLPNVAKRPRAGVSRPEFRGKPHRAP